MSSGRPFRGPFRGREYFRGRGGMTLLEVLVTLALLSAFIAGAGAWLVAAMRAGRDLGRGADARAALELALACLRADIDEASHVGERPVISASDGVMTAEVLTAHAAGDVPAWRQVSWRWERASGELVRSEQRMSAESRPERRVVLRNIAAVTVTPGREEATTGGRTLSPSRALVMCTLEDRATAVIALELCR